MLRAIDRRTHNQYAIDASLHGIKIPLKFNQDSPQTKTPELTEEEKVMMEKIIQDGQRRVRARYV
jgi:hypothetical protein